VYNVQLNDSEFKQFVEDAKRRGPGEQRQKIQPPSIPPAEKPAEIGVKHGCVHAAAEMLLE